MTGLKDGPLASELLCCRRRRNREKQEEEEREMEKSIEKGVQKSVSCWLTSGEVHSVLGIIVNLDRLSQGLRVSAVTLS